MSLLVSVVKDSIWTVVQYTRPLSAACKLRITGFTNAWRALAQSLGGE